MLILALGTPLTWPLAVSSSARGHSTCIHEMLYMYMYTCWGTMQGEKMAIYMYI